MEAIHLISHRLLQTSKPLRFPPPPPRKAPTFTPKPPHSLDLRRLHRSSPPKPSPPAAGGWLSGLGLGKKAAAGGAPPEIVKAGDPVLHEPAAEVPVGEITSERIQKIVDDMVAAMRRAPGVGLAAPQIGVPLRIIVLEDTREYISYAPKKEIKAQDRRPFDLLFF